LLVYKRVLRHSVHDESADTFVGSALIVIVLSQVFSCADTPYMMKALTLFADAEI
jgi:hypothetical protein